MACLDCISTENYPYSRHRMTSSENAHLVSSGVGIEIRNSRIYSQQHDFICGAVLHFPRMIELHRRGNNRVGEACRTFQVSSISLCLFLSSVPSFRTRYRSRFCVRVFFWTWSADERLIIKYIHGLWRQWLNVSIYVHCRPATSTKCYSNY